MASYVCPAAAPRIADAAAMAMAGMPCPGSVSISMDDTQANLCHAHCQSAQQSADTYKAPSLPALEAVLAGAHQETSMLRIAVLRPWERPGGARQVTSMLRIAVLRPWERPGVLGAQVGGDDGAQTR